MNLFPVITVISEILYLFLVPFLLSISVRISIKFLQNFRVSEIQFISIRIPLVGIPVRSVSAEHGITEFCDLRIALY